MKQEERVTMLLSVNIQLKRICTETFLTVESLSYFVQYNFHEVSLWNSRLYAASVTYELELAEFIE